MQVISLTRDGWFGQTPSKKVNTAKISINQLFLLLFVVVFKFSDQRSCFLLRA